MRTELLPGESLVPEVGEDVFYRSTQLGGYGFTRLIPAKVVRITKTGRVTIEMAGGVRRTVTLWAIERRRPTDNTATKE